MRALKVNDFFCGCGGMGIAFKNAGFEIAGAWDFDKYAVQTYRANVGDHVRQQDIKEMTYKDIPKADVWAFGFPCQDLSVAGKHRGMVLKCEECGEEIRINPEEYQNNALCPYCGNSRFKAASRSGCFFEIMRLLEETERNIPANMPAVIIAENVRGLRPYLPVLNLEYERHGYTAHAQMFNSKYWNVAQNRERYAVVGTRDCLGLNFVFPEEQHEFVPKLSSQLEKDVDEKYFLPDEKAKTIIAQAAERIKLGKCHACITPGWLNKKQNGTRAKEEEEPMFTLTAANPQGIIVGKKEKSTKFVEKKLLEFVEKNGYIPKMFNPHDCIEIKDVAPTATAQCSRLTSSSTVLIVENIEDLYNASALDKGKIISKIADISPCLMERDYKRFSKKAEAVAVIEERKGKSLKVRKLTPKEYGILQAFPMDDWKQVVSDSQAYKQFGNAVTTTVFTAIAKEIKKSILQSESEEPGMEKSEEWKGMNAQEGLAENEAGQGEENQVAEREEPGNIQVDELAEKIVANLFEKKHIAGDCL